MSDDTMRRFGDWGDRVPPIVEDAEQIDTPTDRVCMYCLEHFREGQLGYINVMGVAAHHECGVRAVVGSVGHQLGRCSCNGGTDEDPPGMTKREAAIAACFHFEGKHADREGFFARG